MYRKSLASQLRGFLYLRIHSAQIKNHRALQKVEPEKSRNGVSVGGISV